MHSVNTLRIRGFNTLRICETPCRAITLAMTRLPYHTINCLEPIEMPTEVVIYLHSCQVKSFTFG